MLDKIFPKIHTEGYKFLVIFIAATIVLYFIHGFLGFVGFVLSIWVYYFFRDPDRVSIDDDNYLTSPADGLVLQVLETNGPKELELENKKFTKISIFMNVFDCHVNRTPCAGKISQIVYKPGKFFNASLDKASEENERQMLRLDLEDGRFVGAVQIAGLVARRIVCYLEEGQKVLAGERFGLIRFGSRVDIYLPPGVMPQVVVGQRCVAGETVLADLISDEVSRTGEIR